MDRGHCDPIRGRVQIDGRDRVAVDIGGDDRSSTGFGRDDTDEARPRAEVEHPCSRHPSRLFDDIAGQSEAAGPEMRPIGRAETPRIALGQPPEPALGLRLVNANSGHARNVAERQIRPNESGQITPPRRSAHRAQRIVGMTNSAPARMPVGHRAVIVLILV